MTRALQLSARESRALAPVPGNGVALAASPDRESAAKETTLVEDLRLVTRCLAGDESGWRDLYDWHHPLLLKSLRLHLGARSSDDHLVLELAARVWFALVRRGGRLLGKFDPARQRGLGSYLAGLARIEVLRYFRSEGRRKTHESRSVRTGRRDATTDDWQVRAILDDLMTTLTPAERECLEGHLAEDSHDGGGDLSRQSGSSNKDSQRRHRVRIKIREYFRKG